MAFWRLHPQQIWYSQKMHSVILSQKKKILCTKAQKRHNISRDHIFSMGPFLYIFLCVYDPPLEGLNAQKKFCQPESCWISGFSKAKEFSKLRFLFYAKTGGKIMYKHFPGLLVIFNVFNSKRLTFEFNKKSLGFENRRKTRGENQKESFFLIIKTTHITTKNCLQFAGEKDHFHASAFKRRNYNCSFLVDRREPNRPCNKYLKSLLCCSEPTKFQRRESLSSKLHYIFNGKHENVPSFKQNLCSHKRPNEAENWKVFFELSFHRINVNREKCKNQKKKESRQGPFFNSRALYTINLESYGMKRPI